MYFTLILAGITSLQLSCSQLDKMEGSSSEKKLEERRWLIKRLWVRNTLGNDNFVGPHPLNRAQPILTQSLVIVSNGQDSISAFNRRSGQIEWRRDIDGGSESGAILVGNRVYFGASDSYFYALDAYTGEEKWKFKADSEILAKPTHQSGYLYFLSGNNRIYKLSLDGKFIWSQYHYDTSPISVRGGSQPWVKNGKVYVGLSSGLIVALSDMNGKTIWSKKINKNQKFSDVDSSPIVEGNRLYIASFDGATYCLNVRNGQTIWSIDQGGHSPVILREDKVYFSTNQGKMVAADKMNGKKLWEYQTGLSTQPIYHRGLIIFGEFAGDLIALDAGSGQKQTSYSTGLGIMGLPSITKEGQLYFMSASSNLWAMKIGLEKEAGKWPWE